MAHLAVNTRVAVVLVVRVHVDNRLTCLTCWPHCHTLWCIRLEWGWLAGERAVFKSAAAAPTGLTGRPAGGCAYSTEHVLQRGGHLLPTAWAGLFRWAPRSLCARCACAMTASSAAGVCPGVRKASQ